MRNGWGKIFYITKRANVLIYKEYYYEEKQTVQ